MDRLSLDYALCMEGALDGKGPSAYLLEALRLPLEDVRTHLSEQRRAGGLAWMDLPGRDPAEIVRYAGDVAGKFENLLVLGIGGSALGTSALQTALLRPYYNMLPSAARGGTPRLFVVDNVDPDQIAGLFSHLDPRTTLVNVVSKSGTTAETMAAYLLIRKRIEDVLGPYRVADHFVFTTDHYSGVLRQVGRREGIQMFDIPQGVGGRFSVLTPVGLVPAALTGMDVGGLLEGAREMQRWIDEEPDLLGNPAYLFAVLQFLHQTRFHRSLSVMMPYSSRLWGVADWFRQLWAESLGKATDRQGRVVHAGMTPIAALGATDQHSQIQLYSEGPDDKVLTFLRVEHFDDEVVIPRLHPEIEALEYLGGHTMAQLLNAEQEATAWALARRGRPSMTIRVPRVEAPAVGQLFYLFEVATAVMGELANINAFDQPGVELGKEAAYALMGRPGFDELAGEIRALKEANAGFHLR